MTKRLICLCPLLLAFSTASASTAQVGAAPPMPPGSDFSPRVDNPWFPLVPGTRYVYDGVTVSCFQVEAPSGWEPTLDWEHDEARWCSRDEAEALLYWPEPREVLRELR